MGAASEERALDPDATRFLTRVRWMMALSILFTGVVLAAMLAVIGYRVSRGEGSRVVAESDLALPPGSKLVATALGGERLALTLEVEGETEIRLFDAQTLQPQGRLRLRAGR